MGFMSTTATDSLVLHYALESAKDKRKTGHIHIIASLSGSVKDAILVVKSGELVGCNYFGMVGKEAVRVLLQADALKSLFVRHDVSKFTPHSGIPSVEEILHKLHHIHPAESAVQQSTKQAIPETHNKGGKLHWAAEILATVVGEEEARIQIRDIMKQYSIEDDAEDFIEACIDLATMYVGEQTARLMFEEVSSSVTET